MRELERRLEEILEAAELEDAVLGNDHGHRWPDSAEDTEAIAAWKGTVAEIIRRGNAITDAGVALNRELARINPPPPRKGLNRRERWAKHLAERGEA